MKQGDDCSLHLGAEADDIGLEQDGERRNMSGRAVLICPHCGSQDVLAGRKWCICDNCGERFASPEQETGKGLKLFVSYSHKEEEICTRIVRALQERGHAV